MSAEYLRETAALMRERAEAATKGVPGGLGVAVKWSGLRSLAGRGLTTNEAEHLATWSDPAVALAVAKLLEGVAERHAPMGHPMFGVLCCLTCNLDLEGDERGHCEDLDDALAVARAYRGDA